MTASTATSLPERLGVRDVTAVEPAVSAPGAAARTPYLHLDVATAVRSYRELRRHLPDAVVHYAVKANPHTDLLAALAREGSKFDVASPNEVMAALGAGAAPADLVYSNPVKRRADVAAARALGVDLFVVDSLPEAHKVADAAPGSAVLCRLVTSGQGSDWPLSRKFGCATVEAIDILRAAARLGLDPAGVSFHVGSQQRDPSAWREPVRCAAHVFEVLRAEGLPLRCLDLGGGFPADHEDGHPPLEEYAAAIDDALTTSFGRHRPHIILEPGRGISGNAGTLVSSVLAVIHRGGTRWVYLDAGVYSGLVETLDEAIRYRLRTSADGGPTGPAVLAGPTCDSADVLYERTPVDLPLALAEGDLVELTSCGAYSTCYSSVGFNGFEPLRTVLAG